MRLEQLDEVWRQRAIRLSRRPVASASVETRLQVLVVALGNERYGIDLGDVAEVLPPVLCTPVPGAPAVIAGVINVHGEIRPVMNLKLLFGLPDTADGPSPVILLHQQGLRMGLRVDRVEHIRAVDSGELRCPEDGNEGASRYLKGLTPDTLLLLSTEALFTKFSKDEATT